MSHARRSRPLSRVKLCSLAVLLGACAGATAQTYPDEQAALNPDLQRAARDALNVQLPAPNPLPEMSVPLMDEVVLRRSIIEQSRALFDAEQFEQLEELAEQYRTTDRQTPSGVSKLRLLYTDFDCGPCTTEEQFRHDFAIVRKYRAAYPNSPTPILIEGRLIHGLAWKARGGDYSNKVTREQWNGFYARLSQLFEFLVEHEEVAGEDPEYLRLMAELGMSGSLPDAEFSAVMGEAMASTPDYFGTYFIGVQRSLPKWRNDPAYIENLARAAAQANEQTDGMAMYARIYYHAFANEFRADLYRRTDVDRETLHIAIADLLRHYPDKKNFENFGQLACAVQDRALAAAIIHRLQVLPAETYLTWPADTPYQSCRNWLRQTLG